MAFEPNILISVRIRRFYHLKTPGPSSQSAIARGNAEPKANNVRISRDWKDLSTSDSPDQEEFIETRRLENAFNGRSGNSRAINRLYKAKAARGESVFGVRLWLARSNALPLANIARQNA